MPSVESSGVKNVRSAFATCRGAVLTVIVFSMFINLLMLTGPLFMLQIYDRVLSSRSLSTLAALVVLVMVLYALYGFLDFVRSRVVARIARIGDGELRGRIFDAVTHHAVRQSADVRTQPMQDLGSVRQFLQGPGPTAFLDMPWTPVFLGVIFLMHWWLGLFATIAAVLLVAVAIVNDRVTRRYSAPSHKARQQAEEIGDESRANAEVITVLGMQGAMRDRWFNYQDELMNSEMVSGDRGGILSSTSKTLRLMAQSAILAIGAYLAVMQEITPGTMIAASIIMTRALAPVDGAVGHWAAFQAFRRAWERLNALLRQTPPAATRMDLPKPKGNLSVENLIAFVPGAADKLLVYGVGFDLKPGSGLGIIGPTGAGKSTLARALVGAWPAMRGRICIDGASLEQWDPAVLGRHIGYLPQRIELFDGTIAENIGRFDPDPDPDAIVAAATQARVHQLILQMPEGYNTRIGESGAKLSAGQRQRIGLARALYGDPCLVVLDEPNANLDGEGEAALIQALLSVRENGGTVVLVAHRPSALAALDQLMILRDGRAVALGPKDEILKKVMAKQVEPGGKSGGLAVVAENRS